MVLACDVMSVGAQPGAPSVEDLVAGKRAELAPTPAAHRGHFPATGVTHSGASSEPPPPDLDYLALADAPLFLPRNYLYWGTPSGSKGHHEPLIFGLEYALHLPIFSNLRDHLLVGKHWSGAVTLSFEGALRMLALDSKPVRMPSYRPNMSAQLFYSTFGRLPFLVGLRISLFHHSNGQERCTFNAGQDDQSAACTETLRQVRDPRRDLNRIDGDFTTNGELFEI